MLRPEKFLLFDLQSLDKRFDDGLFDFLDNLVNFFGGFISYSLDNRFDDGFFNFLDNLANFSASGSSTSASDCSFGSFSTTAPYYMGAMTCSYPIKYI